MDEDLLGGRDEVLTFGTELCGDNDLTITTLEALTEGDHPIDLRYNSRVGRIACFEELCHTG